MKSELLKSVQEEPVVRITHKARPGLLPQGVSLQEPPPLGQASFGSRRWAT